MALAVATVLEVRSGGDDTNGGGFVTGASGTDWSQQNAAQYSVADGVTAGTTTITSATANFGTDVVGNLIYVAGGTGSVVAGWYQIISRTNSTTIVVDRSTGLTAGTGVTLKIGGALASPGQAGAIAALTSGIITYVKYNASAFIITTASTNVSGGCVLGTNTNYYVGYDTTRTITNLDANRPTLQLNTGVSAATIFTTTGTFANFRLDGNLQTTSRGASANCFRCHAMKFTNSAFSAVANYCTATLCTTSAVFIGAAYYCDSYANVNIYSFNSIAVGCKAFNNSGASGHGFATYAMNCTAYGNGGAGFRSSGTFGNAFINCIAEGNAGFGYDGGGVRPFVVNCADYNNSARINTSGLLSIDINPISGSGSFFVNAAGGNFALNNTAGAGALARAAGLSPSADGLTTNYIDIGAHQHQDAGGAAVAIGRGNLSGGMQ